MSEFDDAFESASFPALLEEFGTSATYASRPRPRNPEDEIETTVIVVSDVADVHEAVGRIHGDLIRVDVSRADVDSVNAGVDLIEIGSRTYRVEQVLSESSAHWELLCR